MDETRDWVTRAEAADMLGKSVRTIDNWIKSGHLYAYRFGPREVRIPTEQFITRDHGTSRERKPRK